LGGRSIGGKGFFILGHFFGQFSPQWDNSDYYQGNPPKDFFETLRGIPSFFHGHSPKKVFLPPFPTLGMMPTPPLRSFPLSHVQTTTIFPPSLGFPYLGQLKGYSSPHRARMWFIFEDAPKSASGGGQYRHLNATTGTLRGRSRPRFWETKDPGSWGVNDICEFSGEVASINWEQGGLTGVATGKKLGSGGGLSASTNVPVVGEPNHCFGKGQDLHNTPTDRGVPGASPGVQLFLQGPPRQRGFCVCFPPNRKKTFFPPVQSAYLTQTAPTGGDS